MSKKFIIFLILTSFVNNLFGQGLISNDEAEKLVKNTLKLPVHIYFKTEIQGGGALLDWFQADGLLKYSGRSAGFQYINTIEFITAKGRACKMKVVDNGKMLEFKTMDLVFGKVIGIASNKEEQTVTIRFSVVPQNSTSPAKMFKKSLIRYELEEQKVGQLVFRKFDSGWQLDSDFDKSHRQIIEKIIGPLEQSYFIEQEDSESSSIQNNTSITTTKPSVSNNTLSESKINKIKELFVGYYNCTWKKHEFTYDYKNDGTFSSQEGKKITTGNWQIIKNQNGDDFFIKLNFNRTLANEVIYPITEVDSKHYTVKLTVGGSYTCNKN